MVCDLGHFEYAYVNINLHGCITIKDISSKVCHIFYCTQKYKCTFTL